MAEVATELTVGQRFNSLEEFKSAIRSISVRQHWDLRVVRSNKKSVVLGCRSSPNCYFRVVCRANKNATYITSLQDTHSCRRNVAATSGSTPARSEASHVRFLLNEIPKLFDLKTKIKGQDVVEAVKRYHGYDISMRQAQRALTKLQPRQSRALHAQVADHENDIPPQGVQPSVPSSSTTTMQVSNETFDPLADDRGWPDNSLSSALMEDDGIDQDDAPTENTSTALVHAPQNNPPLATISHHAQPGPSEPRSLSAMPHHHHHPPQITSLTSTGQPYVHTVSLPVPQPTPSTKTHNLPPSQPQPQPQPPPPPPLRPPLQHQQPGQQTGHPIAAQLVLTNFKIEFTCTSCGTLNQSFFPNQGNVTGNNYLPAASAHGLPPPTPNGRPAALDRVGTETAANAAGPTGFGETDYEGNGTAHGRELPPWGGSLDVSIPPTNT